MPTETLYARADFVNDADAMLNRARIGPLVIALLLGTLIFAWAREMSGAWGGLFALVLFAFDPNFIAHSALVATDVGAATFMFATVYCFWRSMRAATPLNIVATGIALGLAIITKFSSVLVVPMLLVLGLVRLRSNVDWKAPFGLRSKLAGITAVVVASGAIAYGILWLAYGFRYAAVPDRAAAATAESVALAALPSVERALVAERIASAPGTFPLVEIVRWDAAQRSALEKATGPFSRQLARAEMPYAKIDALSKLLLLIDRLHLFPEAYTFGFAFTRQSTIVRDAYLRGDYSERGFASYFLWTALLKIPIPILVAVAFALYIAWGRRREQGHDTLFLVIPVAMLLIVLMRSNINIGHRHSLPLYPFLYTLAGGLAVVWSRFAASKRLVVGVAAIAAIVVSSLFVFSPPWKPQPVLGHQLAYFNELAGGPLNGHRHLVDSNIDWGQDLIRLRDWLREQKIAEPIGLNFFGVADPRYYGIPHRNLFLGYEFADEQPLSRSPRYVAVSTNNLLGVMYDQEARATWRDFLSRATLVGRAGYSIQIYRFD